MENSQKMIMIAPDKLERLQQQKGMVNNTLDSMDKEMERIIRLPDISDSEKWTLYKQTLSKYLHFADENRKPINIPLVSAFEDNASQQQVTKEDGPLQSDQITEDRVRQQTLSTFPKTLKNRALVLYDSLREASNLITWNRNGIVTIKGETIPGSSIVDLISDTVRNRVHSNPQGWNQFNNVLIDLNIPRELIGNKRRLEQMRQQFLHYQSDASSSTANTVVTSRAKTSSKITPTKRSIKQGRVSKNKTWMPFYFKK